METQLKRNIAPKIFRPENINITKPEKALLDNGVQVYLINSGTEDIISIELIFDAGCWYDPIPLVSKFTNLMLTEGGTKKYSAYEIAEMFEYYGASLIANSGKDTASITLSFLNKYIDELIPLLKQVIYEPCFSEKELEIQLHNAKKKHLINLEKPDYVATKKLHEIVYGADTPYGYFEQLEDFDKLNISCLEKFHDRYYINGNFSIIVAGKIPSYFVNLLNKNFGQENLNKSVNNDIKNHLFSNKFKREICHKSGVVQDSLRLGKILFQKVNYSDWYGLKVVSTVLGGYFGSRLMKNIREEKGLTYGIYSYMMMLRNATSFLIQAETVKDKGIIIIDEIYKEIDNLCNELIKVEELELVKNYLLGEFQRGFDGPLCSAEMIKFLIKNNLDDNYYNDYLNTILNIKVEEIQYLAQKYLLPGSFSEIVITE